MKKVLISFMILVVSVLSINTVTLANEVNVPATDAAPMKVAPMGTVSTDVAPKTVFDDKQVKNTDETTCSQAQLLSQEELETTKGAGSYTYRCVSCGAHHGGSASRYLCPSCAGKR